MIAELPSAVVQLAQRCEAAGGRAYLVGGGVRDHLMGRVFHDWDVEVYGIQAESLVRLLRPLGGVNAVGRSFGVYKLRPHGWPKGRPEIDVSIPRRDSKVGPGHKGIAVEGDPTMTIAEASRRRDLTINAIMYDILTHELEDPWGGQEDVSRGVLRAVDRATFLEDPLRALRVVQFAARLAFTVDPELVDICRSARLEELPPERIQAEWEKLLMSARPSVGMAFARDARILERVFPEARACDQDSALNRLAAAQRDALSEPGRRWALMLGTWMYEAEEATVSATLDRLALHRWRGYPLRDRLLQVCAQRDHATDTDAALRNLAACAEVGLVLRVRWAVTADPQCLVQLERARSLDVEFTKPIPLLQGRDLRGIVSPGPRMGQILKDIYQQQLDGGITTRDGALAAAAALAEASGP